MSKIAPTVVAVGPHSTCQEAHSHYLSEIQGKRRNCTDVICLLVFFVFTAIQIALSVIIFTKGGDPLNLVLPHASDGSLCVDPNTKLFYFDFIECATVNTLLVGCGTNTICVRSCPTQNLYYTVSAHRDQLYQNYCDKKALSKYYNGQVPPANVSDTEYWTLASRNICPLYALASSPILNRCLPSILAQSVVDNQTATVTDNNNSTINMTDLNNKDITYNLINDGVGYVTGLLNVERLAQYVLQDFVNSVYLIIVLLAIAVVVTFLYILILRWILAPLIYLTLVGIIGALAYAIYYCITKYLTLKNNGQPQIVKFNLDLSYYFSLSITWLVIGCITGLVFIIVVLVTLVLLKRIRLAIQLIREASKAVSQMFITLLFPLIPLALQLAGLTYFIYTAVILASSGKALFKVTNASNGSSLSVGDFCDPYANATDFVCTFYDIGLNPNEVYDSIMNFLYQYQFIPQLYNLFMFFWFEMFIVGFNQMVLAGCFGTWYWSKSKAQCALFTSLKDAFVYHLGSVAFGSLLIAICKFLRTVIQMAERRIKSATGHNGQIGFFLKFLSCCCQCWIWCLEKFFKFLNRNAYIMIAIYGRSFCTSARDALALLVSNPLRALVLDRVTDFVLFLGRLLITAGVGVLAFYFFTHGFYIDPAWRKYFAPDLNYYWVPLLAIILSTYAITKTFFTVFEMAVDTIFLCAMKDLDINDGSIQKPYAMSGKLLKMLNVKNERQAKQNINDEAFSKLDNSNQRF